MIINERGIDVIQEILMEHHKIYLKMQSTTSNKQSGISPEEAMVGNSSNNGEFPPNLLTPPPSSRKPREVKTEYVSAFLH